MTDAAGEIPSTTQLELTQLSDRQLLARFADRRDPVAFESLVRRHGPMVMGVCRRMLRDEHDADYAFQATFLVLFRKARTISQPELIANWLYGVACHKSLKLRSAIGRRHVHERPLIEAIATPAKEPDRDLLLWLDLQPLLDDELSQLPDEYRAPVVLCDLQGKSIKDAAEQLDCPPRTLSGRLAKAREMLAQMLKRRGLVLSAATLAVLVTRESASAAVPESAVQSMLSIVTATPISSRWVIPMTDWLNALRPATLTAMNAARLKLISSVVLAFGVGTLALAGWANIGRTTNTAVVRAVPNDGRAKAALAHNGPNAAAQNPPLDDGFIVREGKYVLFDGAMTVRVWDDKQFRRIKWSMLYPQPPFKNGVTRGTETLTLDLRPGTPWFLYATSADEIWCYDGEVTLQVSKRIRTSEEPPATPEDDPRGEKGQDRMRYFLSDNLPSWGSLLEYGLPPEKVLQRLPKKLRPASVQGPFPVAAKPALPNPHMPDGFIVSPGDYNLHGGLVKVKVWNEAGKVQWRSTWATHMTRLGTFGPTSLGPAVSQTKGDMRWFLYPESGTRIWSFDGKSKVSLYKHSYEDPQEALVNGKSVITRPGVGTVEIDLPNEKLLLARKPPKAVLQHLPAALRTLSDGFIDTVGDYRLFDDAIRLEVRERQGMIHWTVICPPHPGVKGAHDSGYMIGPKARDGSPWFLFAESPGQYWHFDGQGTLYGHTVEFARRKAGDPLSAPSGFVASGLSICDVNRANEQKLRNQKLPEPVLDRLLKWLHSTVESPQLKDGYIVSVGEYKFFKGATTVKVWEHKGLIFCSVSMPPKISKGVWSPSSNLKRDSRWMLYLESPDQIWSYDGAATVTRNRLSETKPAKTMQNGKLVDSVSTGVSTNPAKLPDQLRDLMSWNPPEPVRRWIPTKNAPKAGNFITSTGEYYLFDGGLLVKLWEQKGQIHCVATWPAEHKGTRVTGPTSLATNTLAKPSASWFLFPESAGTIWFFDGAETMILLKSGTNLPGSPPGPGRASVRADLPQWRSMRTYGDPPEALLERLPPALRPGKQ